MPGTNAPASLSIADAEWLGKATTQRVFAALAAHGHSVRAVGGCVRNSLLAVLADDTGNPQQAPPVTDIDIATTATPDQTIALAQAAGLKTIATGLQHGTITVIADHHAFEVTTLRSDVTTDGRRAEVAFTDDWEMDAARRDLTINAIYADADGTVFDPLGGLDDLRQKRIRFVGDPTQRIREDYLRILRYFRFFAQYGSGCPDSAALNACISERTGLARLSSERIRQELLKLLAAPGAVETIEIMHTHGLLSEILPVAPNTQRFAKLVSRETGAPDAVLRLGSLIIHVADDVQRLSKRLRLANRETKTLELIANALLNPSEPDMASAKRMLYSLGSAAYLKAIKFRSCICKNPEKLSWQELLSLPETWTPPKFPLRGSDLIEAGTQPGPELGEILTAAEQYWLDHDFAPTKSELFNWYQQRQFRSE